MVAMIAMVDTFATQENIIILMLAVFGVPLLFLLIGKMRFRRKDALTSSQMEIINERFNNIWDDVNELKGKFHDSIKRTQKMRTLNSLSKAKKVKLNNLYGKFAKNVKKGKR